MPAVAGAVVSGYGAYKSGSSSSSAARDAAKLTRRQYDQNRKDLAPYRYTGNQALYRLSDIFGFGIRPKPKNAADLEAFNSRPMGVDAFEKSPGYEFRLSEGNRALDRYQSAGRITGGRAVKEAMRYGQEFASGEFGNYVNQLLGMAGIGQGATNVGVNLGQNTATQMGNYRLAGAEAQNNAYAGVNNAFQAGLDNYMTYRAYNDLYNRIPSPAMPSGGPSYPGR